MYPLGTLIDLTNFSRPPSRYYSHVGFLSVLVSSRSSLTAEATLSDRTTQEREPGGFNPKNKARVIPSGVPEGYQEIIPREKKNLLALQINFLEIQK